MDDLTFPFKSARITAICLWIINQCIVLIISKSELFHILRTPMPISLVIPSFQIIANIFAASYSRDGLLCFAVRFLLIKLASLLSIRIL